MILDRHPPIAGLSPPYLTPRGELYADFRAHGWPPLAAARLAGFPLDDLRRQSAMHEACRMVQARTREVAVLVRLSPTATAE